MWGPGLLSRTTVLAALTATAVVACAASGAEAATSPRCAATAAASQPAVPTAGAPCWVDLTPYPFGANGRSVSDPAASDCPVKIAGNVADPALRCYLTVDSIGFRSWNRGLAVTSPSEYLTATAAYAVWRWNGTRWYPDPSFPGQSTCKGDRILWAGKLDIWLVGQIGTQRGGGTWPALCRFDGVNYGWTPLSIPAAALSRVPLDRNGNLAQGSVDAGSCLAWNNCWFFGTYGVALHWDGTSLTNASLGPARGPWLSGAFTAAIARPLASGGAFGLAVTATSTQGESQTGDQLPPRPDGSAPPQLFASGGDAFTPRGYSPETAAQPGDPYRTDLIAVDGNTQGQAWVAGNPVGWSPFAPAAPAVGRAKADSEAAPLAFVSSDGAAVACPATPAGSFMVSHDQSSDAYLWSSVGAFPDGSAVAGGTYRPAGADPNQTQLYEPVIERVSCQDAPTRTLFRIPDPTAHDPATAPLIPADRSGLVTSVAANAPNDAWAATTAGEFPNGGEEVLQPPHVYRLTDGQAPQAPAGDDHEPRPINFQTDPPVFVVQPPVTTTVVVHTTTTTKQAPAKKVVKRLPAAIYAVHVKLVKGGAKRKPRYDLYIEFKVRRLVRLGAEALRGPNVVSVATITLFRGHTGRLILALDPKRWPKRIKFLVPAAGTTAH